MINKKHFIEKLKKYGHFVEIENKQKQALKKAKYLVAHREDGLGNKLINYINVVRLGKKLNKDVHLYWDKNLNKSSQIIHGYGPDEYKYFKNFKNLKFINTEIETLKGNDKWIEDVKFLYFKNENLLNVLSELCTIAQSIKVSDIILNKVKKMENKNFDLGLHYRGKDITAIEQNILKGTNYRWYLRDGLSFGKWFPKNLILKIIRSNKKKILVISNDDEFLKNVKRYRNVKINFLNKKNTPVTEKVLTDIYLLSKCKIIICNPISAISTFLALISKNNIFFPEDYVSADDLYFELQDIIKSQYYRLRSIPFMSFKIIKIIAEKIFLNFYHYYLKEFFRKKIR